MPTISPALVPIDGAHGLSLKEELKRAGAVGRGLAPAGKPACAGPVYVGIFFDGTRNKMMAAHAGDGTGVDDALEELLCATQTGSRARSTAT